MTSETQKSTTSETVRIWAKPKERLVKVAEKKTEREGRPVTEVELVSKAVDLLCDIEERQLGL